MHHRRSFPLKPRCKDFLEMRLRRMVKSILEERVKYVCYGFDFLADKQQHVIRKLAWLCVLLVCIGLCGFQTFDRISHYFSYPVSVSGFIIDREMQMFPHITICYPETKGFFELSNTLRPKESCYRNPIRKFLQLSGHISLQRIWESMNTTTAISSAKGIYSGTVMPLETENKYMKTGICTTFFPKGNIPLPTHGGKIEIILKQYTGNCALNSSIDIYLHDERPNIMVQNFLFAEIGKKNEITVAVKAVQFVNRSQENCLSSEEFVKCEETCFARYLMENINCRLPFFPIEFKKPMCVSDSTSKAWLASHWYLNGMESSKPPCVCKRRCHYRHFNERLKMSMQFNNRTIITLKIDDSHETLIKEELSYSMTDLLSDIGGNSGLYIGLSVLSIFELITKVFTFVTRKKPPTFFMDDPLFNKVVKTYKILTYYSNIKKINLKAQMRSRSLLKLLSISCCSCFWLWTVINRIIYFLQYPTRVAIDISFNNTFHLPSLTICSGDPRVKEMQQIIAKANNKSQFCDVKVWELLHLAKVNANYIWINKKMDSFKKSDGEYVTIFEGTCLDYAQSIDRQGMSPSQAISWYFEKTATTKNTLCGTCYFKVYIKPFSGRYDYFQYRYAAHGFRTMITFAIKEIRINYEIEKCVSEEENDQCMDNCMKKQLFGNITCRLPYMPKGYFPLCETSSAAKHSHLKYIELYFAPPSSLGCRCLPKCVTQIIETSVSTTQTYTGSSIGFMAAHNVVESYKKVRSYTLVKLLCDIGGLLGSLLGLCILTTAETVLKATRLHRGHPHSLRK